MAGEASRPGEGRTALVTGATGFIGRRLAIALGERGWRVRCLVRDAGRARDLADRGFEIREGDVLDPASLEGVGEGVEVAYYLVHSMGRGGSGDFEERERSSARNFGEMARREGVERTVYLGGLGDEPRSKHLRSRQRTAELLAEHGPPLIYFRAGMVVGAGSESYRTLRYLVQRLPAMIAPAWLKTPTQPIAVHDVIEYLVEAPTSSTRRRRDPDRRAGRPLLRGHAGPDGGGSRHQAAPQGSGPAAHALVVIALDRVGHAGGRRGRTTSRRGTLDTHGRHRPGRDGSLRHRPTGINEALRLALAEDPEVAAGPPGRRPPASGGPLPRPVDRACGEHQQGRAPGAGALGAVPGPPEIENLGRGYWEFVARRSLGVFRATEDEEGRVQLLLRGTPLELLRFDPPRTSRERGARLSPGRSQEAPWCSRRVTGVGFCASR